MAGEERGPFPNGVVEAYQPRGQHIALFGVSKQEGVIEELLYERRGTQARTGSHCPRSWCPP